MAKKKEKVISKKQITVYIGKNLPGLSKYTVFRGELPDHIKELAEKDEAIKGLIVPVETLSQARKDICTKGHILNYYANLQNKK